MSRLNKGLFTSNTDLWATPQGFFDTLNREFNFTLDPCALPENAKCGRYFTPDIDGLKQDWGGATVFCNPPYGRIVGRWDSIKEACRSWKTKATNMPWCARLTSLRP